MSPNVFGASEDGIRERWLFRTWAGIAFGETNLTSGAAAILMGAAFRRAEQVRICFELALTSISSIDRGASIAFSLL